MANIQTLLAKIMSAIYGEEVRGAIHDSIEAINDEVTSWTGLQDGTVTTAKLASNAVTTAKIADGAITRAKLNADVVDTTLAVSGAPADAKTTGDKVTELKTEISTISLVFTDGALVSSSNAITSNSGYSYSAYIPVIPNQKIRLKSFFHDSAKAVFVTYDKATVKQSISNTVPNVMEYDAVLDVPEDAYFLRFSCRTSNKNDAIVEYIINPSMSEIVEKTSFSYLGVNDINGQILLPSQNITGWTQGTIASPTETKRIHIDCGYLEPGKITISNAKSDGRVDVVVYSDATHSTVISSIGLKVGNFSVTIPDGGYVVLVGANSAYGAITPSYFDGYYTIVYSQYVNDAIKAIRTELSNVPMLVDTFTEWVQGLPTNRQNVNRVSIYCGKLENGTLKVTTSTGFQYIIATYDSAYYDNQLSATGWKQVTTEEEITTGTYVVIIGCRTNYSAVDSSDVLGKIVVTFTTKTEEAVNENWQTIKANRSLLAQNGIDETLAVPPYYITDNYLDGKMARINTLAQACVGNGGTFAFITDMHWKLNAKKSPALLNYLYHNTHVNKLFGGGDYSDAKHIDDTYLQVASILRDAWKGKAYYAIGNHEYLGNSGVMNTEENLAYYYESYYGSEIVYGSMLRNYFYFNDNGNKIRYVFLNRYAESTNGGTSSNEGLETEQLNWFENVALNVETGWGIIVVVHSIYGINIISDNTIQPYVSTGSQGLVNIIEAYDGNGEIIAVVSGHSHMDLVMRLSNDVPVIITTCDKNKTGGETPVYANYWADREDGTISEQAFDVMVINRESRTINAVRIGCPAMTWTQSGDNYIRGASTEERVITF